MYPLEALEGVSLEMWGRAQQDRNQGLTIRGGGQCVTSGGAGEHSSRVQEAKAGRSTDYQLSSIKMSRRAWEARAGLRVEVSKIPPQALGRKLKGTWSRYQCRDVTCI